MKNSLDQYSKPTKQENTKLSTIYWLNPRDSKKGRLFIPLYDKRFPLKFKVEYEYISKFLEKNNDGISEYEIRSLLRGTNLSTSEYLQKSLDAYISYAQTAKEEEVLIFLRMVEKKWKHLFQRIKLRGNK